MDSESPVVPYSRCELPKGRGSFSDPAAKFSIERQVVGDGGSKVGEGVNGFQCVVFDGDRGGIFSAYPIFLVLPRLMVRLKSGQAWVNRFMRVCRCSWECTTTAASSANSMSRTTSGLTFVLAFRQARLNRLPLVLVCKHTPSVDVPKACHRRREKKTPNTVGANTRPCLIPQQILKGSEVDPSNWMVPCMSV